MNKNGTLVILNDLKKKKSEVEKKYNEQKNKKFTDKQASLYTLGFIGVFGVACTICPTNMYACCTMFVGYGLGIPFTYAYCLFSKEEKLRKELDILNKNIKSLEFELTGFDVKHHYINEKKGVFFVNPKVKEKKEYPLMDSVEEEYVQEESGPVLKRKF